MTDTNTSVLSVGLFRYMVRVLLAAAFLGLALGEAPHSGQQSRRQAFYRSNRANANQFKQGAQADHQGEEHTVLEPRHMPFLSSRPKTRHECHMRFVGDYPPFGVTVKGSHFTGVLNGMPDTFLPYLVNALLLYQVWSSTWMAEVT